MEEGSLGYDRGLVRFQVQTKLDTHIHCQQALFSGAVAGEQVIKIRSFIAFCEYFQFSITAPDLESGTSETSTGDCWDRTCRLIRAMLGPADAVSPPSSGRHHGQHPHMLR
jgi:hypothetical protein